MEKMMVITILRRRYCILFFLEFYILCSTRFKMSAFVEHYSYIMHGRVFSIKHLEKENIELQASFGGLLMKIKGQQKDLERFSVDMM
jgi:hypothetical protein